MPSIRPVSDLRDHLEEILNELHESDEPIFLTENGYGNLVILSMETWETRQFKTEIYHKLIAAEGELNPNEDRLSREEIFSGIDGKKKRVSSAPPSKKGPGVRKKKPKSKT